MKTQLSSPIGLLLLTFILLFSVACDYSASTAPEEPIAAYFVSSNEIDWVSWKPEIVEMIKSQNRSSLFKEGKEGDDYDEEEEVFGFDSKWIEEDGHGEVGNKKLTLNNKVKVPRHALREDAEVSVQLVFESHEDNAYGEVEFEVDGESYQFREDVRITLSYKHLDLPDDFDPTQLTVWWVDPSGEGWVPVEDLEFNKKRKTVNFWINHFTTYGWAY